MHKYRAQPIQNRTIQYAAQCSAEAIHDYITQTVHDYITQTVRTYDSLLNKHPLFSTRVTQQVYSTFRIKPAYIWVWVCEYECVSMSVWVCEYECMSAVQDLEDMLLKDFVPGVYINSEHKLNFQNLCVIILQCYSYR